MFLHPHAVAQGRTIPGDELPPGFFIQVPPDWQSTIALVAYARRRRSA